MKIAYASDRGRVRSTNQDYTGVFINKVGTQLAIVADGVGGENGGDVASTMAVSHLGNEWQQTGINDLAAAQAWVKDYVSSENETIVQAAKRYKTLQGMATTIVMAVILPDRVGIANLGDSRAYLIRQQAITQLTEDHNLAEELVQHGAITPAQARKHPGRNVITRQLGADTVTDVDWFELPLQAGDYLLMTSDGMVKHLDNRAILQSILAGGDGLETTVKTLIEQTNQAGGSDNITVLLGYQESEGQ
ncbi:Stp1/IreP family PP2C-type Ser/Thr phosphatase [Weissella halotolerans]|uniref:Serine threonine protein phosphatase n=1 Tax=Weissella halotolerans DSM 20190 TaxID=1123500 RepID=A0A0R2FTX3_9LACO|nr:Stp1/IreP family PP2C-type Ser/Thr phosphatase [Weissella halotolerans]KRN31728.1 serine threonine protein phosphatase [Weissella halotolerans DSM 20190]